MTWVKLPDDALEDPRVMDLDDAVVLAYLRALGWSNRWARDGRIPLKMSDDATSWVWVDAELATRDDDAIQLVWLLEHQPKADEIEQRKKNAAERQERHRRHMASDHSKCDAKRCQVLLSKAKGNGATRDTTRDKRTLRSDSVPSLPEGRGEETGDGDDGSLTGPVATPTEKRRLLAKAIREAPNDLHRQRFRRSFDREFGALYGRQATA